MSPDQPQPDPKAVPSGVTQIRMPSKEAADRGVVCHFDWQGDDIEATGDIARGDLGLVLTRVEVGTSAPTGVTHSLLRRVPLGEVLRVANTAKLSSESQITHAVAPPGEVVITPDEYVIPPGRVLVTDELLRHVALAYLEESGPGKDRAVLQRLEQRFGRPRGTIRTWVNRARAVGWLGGAVQGRMGAEPGTKLILWLSEQMNSDEMLLRHFAELATALSAPDPSGVAAGALRGWRDPAGSAFPYRTGIAPSHLMVAAQLLYGRTADAELATRIEAGEDDAAAFDQIVSELREELAKLKP